MFQVRLESVCVCWGGERGSMCVCRGRVGTGCVYVCFGVGGERGDDECVYMCV